VFGKVYECCDRGLWFIDGFLYRNVRQWTFFNTPGEVRKELEDPLSWVFLGFLIKIFRRCKLAELSHSDPEAAGPVLLHVSPASQSEHDFSGFASGSNGNSLVALKALTAFAREAAVSKIPPIIFPSCIIFTLLFCYELTHLFI
jgi:hypothetical protein